MYICVRMQLQTRAQALCIIPLIDTVCTSFFSFINQENFSLHLYKVPVYRGNERKRERWERKQQLKKKKKDSKNQVITATKQVKQGQIYRAEKLKPPFSFPKLHSAHYHTKTSPILLLLTRPMYGCISFPCCALYGLVSIVTGSQWLKCV